MIEQIDPAARRAFRNQLFDIDRANLNFLSSIACIDESQLKWGNANFHNKHVWAEENPHTEGIKAILAR